ncbi:hypothetical protein REPUB_Repub08aG0114800 [Reevesia pubescens]
MASCCNSMRLEGFLSSAFRSSKPSSNAISIPSFSSSHLYTHRFPLKRNYFSVLHSPYFTIKASSSSSSSSSSTTIAEPEGIKINSVPTKPIEGQKTGTSGLRKKVKVFMQENYLSNWIQALFNSLPPEDYQNGVLVLGGDGRYFNREASQIIIKIAAGNGVGKILVGREGIMSTPAVSAVIRKRKANIISLFILISMHGVNVYPIILITAAGNLHLNPSLTRYMEIPFLFSHSASRNGIGVSSRFNSYQISEIKMAEIPDVSLSHLGVTMYGNFSLEVIDPVSDYLELMERVFDFELIRSLLSRSSFRVELARSGHENDQMHALTCLYLMPCMLLPVHMQNPFLWTSYEPALYDSISNGVPLEDFGHGHPNPNLTYAKDLVNTLYSENGPDFGAASDGDGDRNMILGKKFFVTPSDSVAIIAANAQEAIPYFQSGPKVPTGWKFFGNLMDAGKLSICGEESFGTGSDHICEKDGIWAVLAWLSIVAYRNKGKKPGEKLVSVSDVVKEHWATYGRNFFSRYDYEEIMSFNLLMTLHTLILVASKQGVRFVFTDGSRIIFRLSGTGSAGATVRIYIEQFEPDISKHDMDAQVALKPLIDLALSVSKLKDFTGRDKPTVIT